MNMKKLVFAVLIFLVCSGVSAQDEIISNYNQAFSFLEKLNHQYGYSSSPIQNIQHLKYKGMTYESGHYSYPEKRYELPVEYDILSGNDRFFIEKEMAYEGKAYQGKFLLANDSCYLSDYWSGKESVKKANPERFTSFYLPLNLLTVMNRNKHSLHLIPSKEDQEITLGFNDFAGNKFYVIAVANSHIIKKIIQLNYSSMYGDVYREIRFQTDSLSEYASSPNSITISVDGFIKESLTLMERNLSLDLIDSTQLNLDHASSDLAQNDMTLELLSPQFYLLKLHSSENKLLVREHDSFLSIYDAPGNIHMGNEIIAFLEKRFEKPIEFSFISHHHPDHSGGIPSFYRTGTTIVTTEGNVEFFKKLSTGKHTICEKPIDNTNEVPQFSIIDSLSNKTFFESSDAEVSVYEIGSLTHHTDEYLVFYFPKPQILFVPDLVFFSKEKVIPQKERAYAVYELITNEKLSVDKIVTGWPLREGFHDFATTDDLKEILVKNYPNIR